MKFLEKKWNILVLGTITLVLTLLWSGPGATSSGQNGFAARKMLRVVYGGGLRSNIEPCG